MKYNVMFFFVLFSINNLLHHVSEKVIIVIFIVFLFFLMKLLSTSIDTEFKSKLKHLLNDINMYMNAVFTFLYINKLFYLNTISLAKNTVQLTSILTSRVEAL
jgi:hypothetical protein